MARRTTMVAALVAALLALGTVTAVPAAAEEATPAPPTPSASAEPSAPGDGGTTPDGSGVTAEPTTEPAAPSPAGGPTDAEPPAGAEPTTDPSAPPAAVEPAPGDDVEQPVTEAAPAPEEPAVDEVAAEDAGDEVQEAAPEHQEEAAAAPGDGPTPLAAPGDITLALSTTCADASVRSDLANSTDEPVQVRVRVTAEDGETSTQQLVLGAAERRSVQTRLGDAGEVQVEVVEVLEDGDERLLATAGSVVAECLEVAASCEELVFTNPGGNEAVTLTYVDFMTEEEAVQELAPGESLSVETDVDYVATFTSDDSVQAGEDYAELSYEDCGLQVVGVVSACPTADFGALALFEEELFAPASVSAFVLGPDEGTATYALTDPDGTVVAEGSVDLLEGDLVAEGVAPGSYTLTVRTAEESVSIAVVVPECLEVALTCDTATFTQPAANEVGIWFGETDAPLDADELLEGFESRDIEPGASITVALLDEERAWIAVNRATFSAEEDVTTQFQGVGVLPPASDCDPAPSPDGPPAVDPVTDSDDDGGEVPVATGADGGGTAVVTGGHGGPVLAATGGPSGALGVLGLVALTAGAAVLRRRR